MPDNVLQFRAMTAADIPAGLALCRNARWNQMQRDWELFLQLSPTDCRVAVKNERVVGTVTTVSYQDRFGWIGMVLVDPAERQQGIGTGLLQEALDVLRDQPAVGLDATPAGREVYLKLGFVDECRLSRMEAIVADLAPDENNPARRMTEADLPEVFELDRKIFGADRRAVLAFMFSRAPEYAWVLRHVGKVTGFTFGRHGFNFEHIGPVIAESAIAASQLVAAVLKGKSGRTCIIDAAHHDAEWLRWLETIGFREQRPFIRMIRGNAACRGLPEQQFAILGPEFG